MYAHLGAEPAPPEAKPSTVAPVVWGLIAATVAVIAIGKVAGEVRALHRDVGSTGGGKKLADSTTKTIGIAVGVGLVGLVGWRIAERVGWTKLGPPAFLLINQHPLEPPHPNFAPSQGRYASQAFRWDEREDAWIPLGPPVQSGTVASVTRLTKGIPQYGSVYGVAKWSWHGDKGRWVYDSTEYGRELTKAVS